MRSNGSQEQIRIVGMVEETRTCGQVDGPNKGFNWTVTG